MIRRVLVSLTETLQCCDCVHGYEVKFDSNPNEAVRVVEPGVRTTSGNKFVFAIYTHNI